MERRIEVLEAQPLEVRRAAFADSDALTVPEATDVAGRMGSFISDHPTNFYWRADIGDLVDRVQRRWPWQTYINTYYWHPPYHYPTITKRYDMLSFDVWGGGVVNGEYTGYRGKPLPDNLHAEIHEFLFNLKGLPNINWIMKDGWMWVYGRGWVRYDPYDPQNADLGHRRHLHVTYW